MANVVDANGKEIPVEPVHDNLPPNEEYRSYWAVKVSGKDFAAPLNISMNIVNVSIQPVVFHFDPGADPKPGQSWDINQDVQIGDARARILKANLTTMGSPDLVFEFDLQVEPNALADVSISMPINQCNGGGGGLPEPSEDIQTYAYICRTDLPVCWKHK